MPTTKYPFVDNVLELMLDAVCIVDREGFFIYVNSAFEAIFGYQPKEIIGRQMMELVFSSDLPNTMQAVAEIQSGEHKINFENRWIHKNGNVLNILWSARWSETHQARIAVARDISERKKVEQQLAYLANHDSLTKLPNRALFIDRLNVALRRSHRDKIGLSVLFIDLDNFKGVNDQHGHGVGDALLREVAERLRRCIREMDTIGRIGGDEFVVLIADIRMPEYALTIAEKIRQALAECHDLTGVKLRVTPSIGIAYSPVHGITEEELLQGADTAMYAAKMAGGNQVRLHTHHHASQLRN